MPQAPNFSGAPSTTALVDKFGNPLDTPTTNADGSRSTRAVGAPSFATGQIPVTTSGTLVVAARAGRQSVTLTSVTAVAYAVGPVGAVTTATGFPVPAVAGASVTIATAGAVYAVGASAVTIGYMETF